MIRFDNVTLTVRDHAGWRAALDRVSFDFTPGIWHLAAEPAADARLVIQFLAGYRARVEGTVRCRGARSWPLGQFAPFGPYLSGLDIIDTLASLYVLEPSGTFRLFREMMDEPEWLPTRFDRWPQPAQRQFGHVALLAPVFDIYLLDVTPQLPQADFYRRWHALFRQRIAGKTVIMASGQHRATLRDFAGERLHLSGGVLRRVTHGGIGGVDAVAAE